MSSRNEHWLHAPGDCPGQALLVQMGGSGDTESLISHMKFGVLWFGPTNPGVSYCFCLKWCVEQQEVRQGFGRKVHFLVL